jgi:hypothetical protein
MHYAQGLEDRHFRKSGTCLAPKAQVHSSLGQRPRELTHLRFPALKARFIAVQLQEEIRREAFDALNRAFSA